MKLTKHAWILWGILLALALTLAFVLPFAHTTVFWIALGCTLLMFVVCAAAFIRAFRRGETLLSKILGWPIFRVGLIFLGVQLALAAALMALSGLCPAWAAVLAEALLLAAALACLTVQDAVREAEAHFDGAPADQTAPWKEIRRKAAALASAIGTEDMRRLADDIRYADPMPTELDEQLSALLDILSSYATADNMQKATQLLARRNALAKDSKK